MIFELEHILTYNVILQLATKQRIIFFLLIRFLAAKIQCKQLIHDSVNN